MTGPKVTESVASNRRAILEAARKYAQLGLHVIPTGPDKRPLTQRAFKTETAEESLRQFEDVFNASEDRHVNVAIRTGTLPAHDGGLGIKGILVVDIDVKDSGVQVWQLLTRHYPLPPTAYSITGSGGLHYFFRADEASRKLTTAIKVLVDSSSGKKVGIDVRNEGGYVVAPPSVYANGATYTWIESIERTTPATIPNWLAMMIESRVLQLPASAAELMRAPADLTLPSWMPGGETPLRPVSVTDAIEAGLEALGKATSIPLARSTTLEMVIRMIRGIHTASEPDLLDLEEHVRKLRERSEAQKPWSVMDVKTIVDGTPEPISKKADMP